MSFFNLYRHNFVRVAVGIPEVRVADPAFNAERTLELAREAAAKRCALALFPELGLSSYTCEDLFQQQALLDASLAALRTLREATRRMDIVLVVGLPLRIDGLLYNCAAVLAGGRIRGVVPKTYLPGYREFYETRWFASGDTASVEAVDLLGEEDVPFGARLVFQAESQPLLTFAAEICEDLWTPIPPSSFAALAGANLLLNLSASNVTVGKERYRNDLVANQSARCLAAYLFSAAGYGESTTDMAWDGQGLVYENGTRLAASERFAWGSQLLTAEIDLDRIVQDRMRQTSFAQTAARHADEISAFRTVQFPLSLPLQGDLPLERIYERFPYVPSDPATRDARCEEVYAIQVQGLVRRLRSMNAKKVVIGVSGGLDSTQALLVCARAMDVMKLPRKNIIAVTMPGFATGARTLAQARRLMAGVGATAMEIDIRPSCLQMLKDIGHPYAAGRKEYDITFENVQAGERTSHLFRLANLHNAPVVGTGDLSELALGWATYGVGDHMSHYAVNASVPKTLIRFLIRWVAEHGGVAKDLARTLHDVAGTAISPELIPGSRGNQPAQQSEATIGPYELQDFHLYYTLRFGYAPSKVAFLAWSAWHDAKQGRWPGVGPGIPESERNRYGIGEIRKWLEVFVRRFFAGSQYKRSAIPNAPKVGSGGSLSPRSDWRAPSDGTAEAWLADLAGVPAREPVPARRRAR